MTTNLNRYLERLAPINPYVMSPTVARRLKRESRLANGLADGGTLLTLPDDNAKLDKGKGYNCALSLAPADQSVMYNSCTYSTPGCREGCVAHNGNGQYKSVSKGRIWKTKWLAENPVAFITVLAAEIAYRSRLAEEAGVRMGMRLNAFTDLRWEIIAPKLFNIQGVNFYDYTKWPATERHEPYSYRLTYSWTGETATPLQASDFRNAAVVFSTKKDDPLPEQWAGREVIDGDKTDARYDDPQGVIVGLRAKGKAKKDTTGFVVQL